MTTEQLPETMTREEVMAMLADLKTEIQDEMPIGKFTPDNEGMENLENGAGSGGFPWMYWKRRDGRVIYGPEPRETLYPIYLRKGYTPLQAYGKLPTPGSRVSCCPQYSMKDHPYHILMARGGAGEMAVQEVIQAGWHLNPPTIHGKVMEFPQLDGVEIETIECPECDKPIYGLAGTPQIMQHMRQHGRAAHEFTRRDTDEALYSIGYAPEPKSLPRRKAPTST